MTTEIIEGNGIIPRVPKWAIVGALWLWFAVALFTHHGAASPYSYAGAIVDTTMQRIDGLVVNHDAPSVRPVTQFFYDGTDLAFPRAHNLKLPIHSMVVATAASFLRSYMLANSLVNLLALWLLAYVAVTMAESLAYPRLATLVAALTCAALPVYTHYIGQPMHYVVGIVVNFLVVMAAMSGARTPFRLGILTAILTLSYDPYVFIAALVTWIVVTIRWTRVVDWGVYVAAAFLPVIAWRGFLAMISNEVVSMAIRDQYFAPIIADWLATVRDPGSHLLRPFVNGHVGLVLSWEMALALVYWPVLVLCVIGSLPVLRARITLPALLALFFLLEQFATAAHDWENNPRRAIPLLFAISCAYFVVVRAKIHLWGWRIAFAVVMTASAALTLSDTFTGNPVVGYIPTGEAMRDVTKRVVSVGDSRLDSATYPKLLRDEPARWWDMAPARVTRPAIFVFANVFVGVFVFALLHLLRERALLPRYVPLAFGCFFLLSLAARFV